MHQVRALRCSLSGQSDHHGDIRAVPLSKSPGSALSRRQFSLLLGSWTASLGGVLGTAYAMLRSLFPNVLFEPTRRFKLGRPEDFNEPSVTFLEEPRLFVIRENHSLRVMSGVCTHLGCTINEDTGSGGFRCPCHGSVFDRVGAVREGPAPVSLASYALSIAPDGYIFVDMDQPTSDDSPLDVRDT